jgi:DNA-binding Lrp family transcriptional regulator
MSAIPILQLLATNARLTDKEIAERLSLSEEEVTEQRTALENNGSILGYQAVINDEAEHDAGVVAFIEVKVTPERDGGFDRLAYRISRFDEVSSCYLASGGFDLLVMLEGKNMREIANFVSSKLSTLDGVLSTSTHFHLKTYKKNGCIFEAPEQDSRLIVSP